jgi:hypothetical protein
MEAVITSKTSVNFYETIRRNIPEDSHVHPNNLSGTVQIKELSLCKLFLPPVTSPVRSKYSPKHLVITMTLYRVSHKSPAIGELGYLAKYGKCKEGKIVENHVFPISSSGIFPTTSCCGATLFTLPIVKLTAMLPR